MSYTKREFVTLAFEAIGYASYVFDLKAEQLQAALHKLDSMVASWNRRGIRLGYPLPGSPTDSDLDEETNVPDAANEAIYANLAIRLAPSVGKLASQDLKRAARESYLALLNQCTVPPRQQLPAMPSGAGNKPWRQEREFLPEPDSDTVADQDQLEGLI